jgi:hypothetical protein
MAFLGLAPSQFSSQQRKVSSRSPWRRPLLGLLSVLVAFSLLGSLPARAQSKEYQIKAAFLFNFAQFVKWPGGSFANDSAPFCIGILGDDPFGDALEGIVQGESIDHHRLTVLRARSFAELKNCQLIFVCKSEEGHVAEILSQLDSKPILTVSEVEGFTKNGGDINFYLQDGKIRFEINPSSAQHCGLRISSQLLNLGKIASN